MTKCRESISLQGLEFRIELENPEADCDIDVDGREHRIIIENLRPNSVDIDAISESLSQKVSFGQSGSHRWSVSTVVSKSRGNNPTIENCSETAYPQDSNSTETIESTIDHQDVLPMSVPIFTEQEDIDVDVR